MGARKSAGDPFPESDSGFFEPLVALKAVADEVTHIVLRHVRAPFDVAGLVSFPASAHALVDRCTPLLSCTENRTFAISGTVSSFRWILPLCLKQ